eukprot:jgi/Tetstr1/437725/TSEL_026379.t1
MPPDSLRRPGRYPIALDRVLEYLLGNPRLQPTADESYYHAACYGAFIAGSIIELRKLMKAPCVTDEITPSFGDRFLRPGTENMGSPEFTELLELYKDRRVYDANIASAEKKIARQRFGGALPRNDRDRD